MFGYWWAFLPDVNSEKSNIGGLGLMITLESTPSGRSAAFTVLLSLLSYSKLYLLQADTRYKDDSNRIYYIEQYLQKYIYLFQQTHDNVFYTVFCSPRNQPGKYT